MQDFAAEPAELRQEMLSAVARVLESGSYVLGKEVEAFERQWAVLCGTTHAIGVGNGMDAIEIGLRALDIGPGDEVITTPMTAFATVLGVLRAGAVPVLADIDLDTAMLSPDSVMRCVTPRTKAILLVHLYGQIGALDQLGEIARVHSLDLVEDCAQAHGALHHGRSAGSFGACGAWSFYPTKNLGAVGDGGALTTASDDLAKKARALRNYGQTGPYCHELRGMNSRLDEIQAALLCVRLAFLEDWTSRRREIASAYRAEIRNPRIRLLPPPEEGKRHVYHLFVVTCEDRQALRLHLRERGVAAQVHYPVAAHRQKLGLRFRRDQAGLPNAERHAATCLSLPCYPTLGDQGVAQVIAAVNCF